MSDGHLDTLSELGEVKDRLDENIKAYGRDVEAHLATISAMKKAAARMLNGEGTEQEFDDAAAVQHRALTTVAHRGAAILRDGETLGMNKDALNAALQAAYTPSPKEEDAVGLMAEDPAASDGFFI